MRSAIPKLTNLLKPFLELIERVSQSTGNRSKRATAWVQLTDVGWSNTEQLAFDSCTKTFDDRVTLSHRDTDKRFVLTPMRGTPSDFV